MRDKPAGKKEEKKKNKMKQQSGIVDSTAPHPVRKPHAPADAARWEQAWNRFSRSAWPAGRFRDRLWKMSSKPIGFGRENIFFKKTNRKKTNRKKKKKKVMIDLKLCSATLPRAHSPVQALVSYPTPLRSRKSSSGR
jgi:hypothetical protein